MTQLDRAGTCNNQLTHLTFLIQLLLKRRVLCTFCKIDLYLRKRRSTLRWEQCNAIGKLDDFVLLTPQFAYSIFPTYTRIRLFNLSYFQHIIRFSNLQLNFDNSYICFFVLLLLSMILVLWQIIPHKFYKNMHNL